MGNGFIVVAVLATVVQGSSASLGLSVEGVEASPDIQVAYNKTTEAFIQAIGVIFGSIEGDLSIDDTERRYLAYLLMGYDYYFAALPSYSQDDAVQKNFVRQLNDFIVTLYKALNIAKSKKGTYLETVTEINAIRKTLDLEPFLTALSKLIGNSSIIFRSKLSADLDILYSNIFGAMISRATVNFGLMDEIPASFEAGAIDAVEAVSRHLYNSLLEDKKSMIVFPQ